VKAVNLIPAENRPGGGGAYGRSAGAAYVLTGFLAGVVLLVCLYMIAHHQIADRQGQTTRLNAEAQAATAQAAALAPYTNFIALRDQRLNAVEQLAGARFDWAHAFHELGRVLPLDVALQSVTGTIGPAGATTPGAPGAGAAGATGATGATGPAGASGATSVSAAQSATPPGSVPAITVAGCTTSQAEVATTIQRLQLVDGVTDVQLTSSTKKGASSGAAPAAGASTSAPCPVNFSLKVSYAPLPNVTLTSGPVGSGTPDSSRATGAAATVALGTTGATGPTGATGRAGATGASGPTGPAPATTPPAQ
jgi:Tfp pilus assembly protein PilN